MRIESTDPKVTESERATRSASGEKASSADFYDSLWTSSTGLDQHHKCRIHAIENLLRSLPKPESRPRRILELGCGSGMVSAFLARHGEIVGVDQSVVGVQAARARIPGRFVVGVLPDIPVPETDFDLVVLSQVLEHFSDPDQGALLRAAREKVRTDGHLIVTTPNRPVSLKMTFESGELQPIENWLAPDDLRALLESGGWEVVRMGFAFSFFPILASRMKVFRAARYFLYDVVRLRAVLEDLLAGRPIGDCTVVLARRRESGPVG